MTLRTVVILHVMLVTIVLWYAFGWWPIIPLFIIKKEYRIMKKIAGFLICLTLCLSSVSLAAPGDTILDRDKAIWLIATQVNAAYPTGIIQNLLDKMDATPDAYTAEADQQEWANWLKFDISGAFGGKIFNREVYAAILYAVEGYHYGNPRIAADRAAPECTLGVNTITCAEDPTGAARDILIWRYNAGEFTEQPLAGVLANGTWTFSPIPSGTGGLTLAYDDGFASFPTLFFTMP